MCLIAGSDFDIGLTSSRNKPGDNAVARNHEGRGVSGGKGPILFRLKTIFPSPSRVAPAGGGGREVEVPLADVAREISNFRSLHSLSHPSSFSHIRMLRCNRKSDFKSDLSLHWRTNALKFN